MTDAFQCGVRIVDIVIGKCFSLELFSFGSFTNVSNKTFMQSFRRCNTKTKNIKPININEFIQAVDKVIDKKSGYGFFVYNLHLGGLALEENIQLLGRRLRDRKPLYPVIVLGDFNADEENPAILYLKGKIALETDDNGPDTNPVPLILVTDQAVGVRDGKLADIAPTMLEMLGVPKPAGMTGESVIL